MDVEVTDLQGKMCKPRKWFSVPIGQNNTAVELIVSGQIVHHSYGTGSQQIELLSL